MSTGMTHDEYVASVRLRATTLAREMLDGKIPFLEGAIELSSLRFEAEVDVHDQDFMVFVVIDTETDSLPIGKSREHWSVDALERHKPDIEKATEWAKQIGVPACESLIRRFQA